MSITSKVASVTLYEPPRPAMSARDEELEQVLSLGIPEYDKKRQFPGIIKLKVDRQLRHTKAVDNFSSVLDNIAEELEKDVLRLSLTMRSDLDAIDEKFQAYFKTLEDSEFLIVKTEANLISILQKSKDQISSRNSVIETFALDLDILESKRADITGAELRKLVDSLIAIAHQLPDKIEHIVEDETFDLNNILTVNRQSHSQLMTMLRKLQVQLEVESVQRWENGRLQWRLLRHEKGLKDFHTHIDSAVFTDPYDRQAFLTNVRIGQASRYDERCEQLNALSMLTAENIKSSSVISTLGKFTGIIYLRKHIYMHLYDS
jgi:hypothetical protein